MRRRSEHSLVRYDNSSVCFGRMACRTCGGEDCSLPTDCPGRPLTAREKNKIEADRLDYYDGRWIGKW